MTKEQLVACRDLARIDKTEFWHEKIIVLCDTAITALERMEELEKENKDIRLINENIQQREWLKFIRFVRRHKEQAEFAKDVIYASEMTKALENCENWYRKIYGERIDSDLREMIEEENL